MKQSIPKFAFVLTFLAISAAPTFADEAPFSLELRHRAETGEGTGRYHTFWKKAEWDPNKTAIVICDMWDSHHSVTAVRRVNELAPHLNQVINAARARGATIIHAPSDCMPGYKEHPARVRALSVPAAGDPPSGMGSWCYKIPEEEKGSYPLDQSDGGEDESAWENAQWNATLKAEGRNVGTPWQAQHPALEIREGDYVAAEGEVVWNILKHEGIEHVALTGVHTNMCVLGRPFGLRRMVSAGMDTALVRDCTDLMYNPERWPFVSHFTGLDLIVDYIEAHVCPTITSDQLAGGVPFRFSGDRRPHLAILIGEEEYGTVNTVPKFARRFLGNDFRVTVAYADETDRNVMPGVRSVEDADMLFVSVRRRGLSADDFGRIRRFVESGKPVIGIRTASHAFAPKEALPEGHEVWATFDPDVFGGNYTGHHGSGKEKNPGNFVQVAKEAVGHPVVAGLSKDEWKTTAWLYKTSPLLEGTQVVAMGRVEGVEQAEPLAWTYVRRDGGRSFYTSLGHLDDFEDPKFQRLLANAVYWSAGLEAPADLPIDPDGRRWEEDWTPVKLEELAEHGWPKVADGYSLWMRTLLRAPADLKAVGRSIGWSGENEEVYLNGEALEKGDSGRWEAPAEMWKPGQLHLVAFKLSPDPKMAEMFSGNRPAVLEDGHGAPFGGVWQMRFLGDKVDGSRFPIPPQFGAPADLIQDWPEAKNE